MRKILKLFAKVILTLLLLIVVVTSVLAIRHKILTGKDEKLVENAYGENFTLSTKEKINYTFYDSPSEEVAVILPGFGCASTHYEFDAFAKGLSNDYKIVIYEPLGVGLSDDTDRDRTSENYCNELHELMNHLGYKSYTLIGHSISGIYSLKYTQMFPDEVKAFIGIDASVPHQVEESKGMEKPANQIMVYGLMKTLYINTGIHRLLTELSFDQTLKNIPTIKSDEDKKKARAINCIHILNKTQLTEIQTFEDNAKEGFNYKFPENLPVLYILSKDTCKNSSTHWEQLHKNLLPNDKSKVICIDGNHYLHNSNLDGVLKTIKDWKNVK